MLIIRPVRRKPGAVYAITSAVKREKPDFFEIIKLYISNAYVFIARNFHVISHRMLKKR